jgi:hypothetical protein
MTRALTLAATLLLAACGSENNSPETETNNGNVEPRELCVNSLCGSKTVLAEMPGAEYLHFTPDGRLFAASDLNIFEVTRNGDQWITTPLASMDCGFAGIEQRGDVLYANGCNQLFAGELSDTPVMEPIHSYSGFQLANGLTADADGKLYAVNGPISTSGLVDAKIARITLNPNNPFEVIEEITWAADGLEFPNGIDYFDGTMYVTDSSVSQVQLGSVKTIPINSDGSAGTVATLSTWPGILDDLTVVDGSYILVADYGSGMIGQIDLNGDILQATLPLTFQNASAVLPGEPPMFSREEILVTEKGLLGDTVSPIGNQLSVFRPN